MGDYDPWAALATRPDITFGIHRLSSGQGWWLPDVPAIVLDDRLTRVQRRCVLAHELIHVENEETNCAATGPGTDRIARRREAHADEEAARRLMPLRDLADALKWALCPSEVATELDVTTHLVNVRLCGLTDQDKASIERRIEGTA